MEQCWIDFDDFLQEALSEGMRLPFHVTVLARNGGMIFSRFYYGAHDQILDSEVLATHEPIGQLFVAPISLLLVDSKGAAKLGSLDELTAN